MKALDALNIVNDLCSSQKGLFTTAQATALGIDRMSLSRLAAHGQIEPVARGVFKAAAAPSIRGEDIYAAWLATDPATPAYLRPVNGNVCVASLGTAAWLHCLGELKPEPITFSHPNRKQTRNPSVRFLRRSLPADDICIAEGIPTTTPERTILDLLDYGEDLSLVAAVLRDLEISNPAAKISDEVNSRAEKCGFGKGFDLYSYLGRI